jgi:V8-like Glu-specific endopeptidase
MNHNGQFHSGFIEGAPRRIDNLLLWQVRMGTLPGSSGSPVFDAKGNLVGIVKGSFRGAESTGFIITIGSIIEFLSAL